MSVHTQCKSGHGIGCQAVRTPYIYSDKHTSAHEEIKISPPNLSEGGSLHSPIIYTAIIGIIMEL